MHLMNSADHVNYGVEYQGRTLRLGSTWLDICRNINIQVDDKRVQASLKLVMFERLKKVLRLGKKDLEEVLTTYADTLDM